ncbi:MAG: VOC family protein [Novosphingobium sp.]
MAIEFAHIGVSVSDIGEASRFFSQGLQLRKCHEGRETGLLPLANGSGREVQRVRFEFPRSGTEIHLIENGDAEPIDADHANPGTCHIAFYTDNIEKALSGMEACGAVLCSDEIVPIVGGVFDGGKALYCAGPDGIRIELMQGPVYLDGTARENRAELPIQNANEATHFGVHVRDRDVSLKFWRDLCGMSTVAAWTESSPATRAVIGYPDAFLHMAILRLLQTQSFCEVIEYRGVNGTPVDNSIERPGVCHFAFRADNLEQISSLAIAAGLVCFPTSSGIACFDPDGFFVSFDRM